MPHYTKDSLELLRQRIDLAEVLSSHLQMSRAGASFKALCPFHDEKTPSFVVQRGDSHYHCFGCGAHGDAIAFLMSYVKMSFSDAVESLAERFGVALETEEATDKERGPSKAELKKALEHAAALYHYLLLHSDEGRPALNYLYARGLTLDFLQQFQVGYAPNAQDTLMRYLRAKGIEEAIIHEAGLMMITQYGKKRDFFTDRITFPIRDAMGSVIGFSSRKYKEETFGGKYINTPETLLFKKSRVLFGLSYSRTRIAKQKEAIIVEGQIDCLRLIHAGFNYVVAGQGTAFGEDHVRELIHLGVRKVFLALDGDRAGQDAAVKIGNLFQKKGIDVHVLALDEGADPDSLLTQRGPEYFEKLLQESRPYLRFVYAHLSKVDGPVSPSKKNEIVSTIMAKVKEWEMPVMVHESLRTLAEVAQVPEAALGIGQISLPDLFIKKRASIDFNAVDPDRVLEGDFIRWLIFASAQYPQIHEIAKVNINEEHFVLPAAYRLYAEFLQAKTEQRTCDLLSLGACLEQEEDHKLLSEIMQRKVNISRAEESFKETVRKMLLRKWMEQSEKIRVRLQSGGLSDDEALDLAKQFSEIKRKVPEVVVP